MTAAAAAAPLPFSSASAAAELRNMQSDMKKCLIFAIILILLVGLVGCAGGEIGFEGVVNRVDPERNMAYATVIKQHKELFAPRLPASIMFSTSELDTELKPGDRFSGDYLSGTIDGQCVRVVCVIVHSE